MRLYVGSQNDRRALRVAQKTHRASAFLKRVAAVSVLFVGLGFFNTAVSLAPERYELMIVRQSDTIWDIAVRCASPDEDVRRLVHEIESTNSLTNSIIRPGDRLRIPMADCR